MQNLDGYVWQAELAKVSGVNSSVFSRMNLDTYKTGKLSFILINTLPAKYQKIAKEKCTSLTNLFPMSRFFDRGNVSLRYDDYLKRNGKKLQYEVIDIGKKKPLKLLRFDNYIFTLLKDGLTPYIVTKEQDSTYAKDIEINKGAVTRREKLIISYQGMQIGFYDAAS